MRVFRCVSFLILAVVLESAPSNGSFSGLWKLNVERSEIRSLPAPPDPFLKVEHKASVLEIGASDQESGPLTSYSYPLDGNSAKRRLGDGTANTVTKWEGAALLINTLVSGPQNYTVMERWKRSADGSTLTIRRTVVRISGESESLLVYENPAAVVAAATAMKKREKPTDAPGKSEEYVLDAGTRILLSLVNSVNTKHASPGDRIYLQTSYPVFSNGRLVIPPGSYVAGTVIDAHRAGRVKGKSALEIRFDSLTLPNGVTRDFRARPGSVETKGNLDRAEGKIQGEGNKGGDARTVGETTAAGASVGGLAGAAAGHLGMGAGIGAAAGAAAGLAGVLASRGPDVIMPRGTSMEMVLDRELRYTAAELR